MLITDYEPKLLWQRFDEIRQIPRCSGHEDAAREWALAFAAEREWPASTDERGNVVVKVPATAGCENAPVVVLQSHLDMVCEKNKDVDHDFAKDPIELDIRGEWLNAKGTTLGSDNGIGVAASMAAAEDANVTHGPLELLFTVDEEVGLTGAAALEPGFLDGRIMLNLDSEELGVLCVGCAGGGDSTVTLPITRGDVPAGAKAMRLNVTGLRGGHSGIQIGEQRGNAVKIMTRVLWEAREKFDVAVASLDGGNKRNAIPREAHAGLYVAEADAAGFADFVAEMQQTLFGELGGREKDLQVSLEDGNDGAKPFDTGSRDRALNLLMAMPDGVVAMSYDIPDLVETSNNLASVATRNDAITAISSSRSSINTALQSVRDRIRSAATLAGADYSEDNAYPGWKPNLDSALLKTTMAVHKEIFGAEPKAEAIHAGLECGIIGEKYPGMDMISFGPNIEHPHSPDERIHIESVEEFWKLLAGVLKALSVA